MYNPRNKNANLLAALMALAGTIPALPTKKAKTISIPSRKKVSKKRRNKRQAVHTPGAHFKPVYLIEYDGKPMTPAMYRRLHMGVQNPRKNGHKSSK